MRRMNNIATLNSTCNRKCCSAQALTGIEFTAEIIIELSRLPYEAKFLKPFILSDVTVIEWDIANTLVF